MGNCQLSRKPTWCGVYRGDDSASREKDTLPLGQHGWNLRTLCWVKQTRLAQTLHDTTYTWNLFMKVKLLETESRKVVTGDWGVEGREQIVKGYTLVAIRWIRSETTAGNTVLYEGKSQRVECKCFHPLNKWGDDMLLNWMGESFHNVYVYQITPVYTLNILKFSMSIMLR